MANVISMLVDTAPFVHRGSSLGGMLKRAKYVARGVAFAGYTREWFDFLQHPEMAFIISHHPYLYHKLQRPYLNCNLNTPQRLEALKRHYGFVLDNFSSETIRQIYAAPGLTLASFALEGLGRFGLRLSCSQQEKEGDFSIGLFKEGSAKNLYSLSFSIWKYKGLEREIFIGGLQGNGTLTRENVVEFTRALYGLRPKALLVFAVQQLAACWSIPSVCAVSDAAHIYRHFQKRKTLSTCYDEFWLECGGKLAGDGMFDLPARFIPREISTIKVNKRQMYRRRYDMLSHFAEQFHEQLQFGVKELIAH